MLNPRLATFLAAAVFVLGFSQHVSAQSCPAEAHTVHGTISVGDGSTSPAVARASMWNCSAQGGITSGWGDVGVVIHDPTPAEGCSFLGGVDGYYWGTVDGNATCSYHFDPSVQLVCLQCSPLTGAFNLPLYAQQGTFSGTVTVLPDKLAGTNGGTVSVDAVGWSSAAVDPATGAYTFKYDPSGLGNNWGLPVYRAPGVQSGPAYGTYTLRALGPAPWPDVQQIATTSSSQDTPVDFVIFTEEPPCVESCCSAPPPPVKAANEREGKPVSVTTGNMTLAHTDAVVASFGGDLTFTRTYNSSKRGPGLYGAFGPGWFHTYERQLSLIRTGVIKLRGANGHPRYFADPDGDSHFEGSIPYTKDEWVDRQPDGSYRLVSRSGGYETYDTNGRLTSIVDSVGNTTTLAYTAGTLTSVTSPSGRTLTLGYTGSQLTTLSGATGIIATYSYSNGLLASVVYSDAAASGYQFTYDASSNLLLSVHDRTGHPIETHTYDGNGWAITSEIADGVEKYTFEYFPTFTRVTDALGNVTTYDLASIWGVKRVTKVTGPCSSCGGGGGNVEQWQYDRHGWTTAYIDANSKTTTYTYDAASGDLLSVTDPLSHATTSTYDAQGRILTRTDPSTAITTYTQSAAGPTSITETVTPTLTRTTNFTYDPQGTLSTMTDPRAKTTQFAYNAARDLVSTTDPLSHSTTFDYDAFGRRNKVTDALLNSTTTVYDSREHVTRVTDPAGKNIDFAYDAGGRRTSVTDALGRVTQYAYDAYGRLTTVTDANLGSTQYAYDAMSNLVLLTDADGHATLFTYDGYRRVTKVTYPGGNFETFAYDAAGRLATRTDRRSVITTYSYDDVGRLTGKTYSDGTPPVTLSYDVMGRLLSAANGTDTLGWTYDLAGQMLAETSAYNVSTVAYTYDLGGNRLSVSLNGSLAVSYADDDDARLASVTRGTKVFSFNYDNAHRRTSLLYPDGTTISYAYDAVSRLTSLAANRGSTAITNFGYTYDDVGNRTHKSALGSAEDYSYDPLYRLTQVVRNSSTTESYTYDPVGNRLSSVSAPLWTYNAQNQLLSQNGATYTYDANDNLAQKVDVSGTWTYLWNAENQLTAVSRNGTLSASFLYDPLGRRVNKGGTTYPIQYTYDGEDLLIERRSSTDILMWIHGPGIDEPLASQNQAPGFTANWKYRHLDGLGSLVKTVNASGVIISSVDYDAFGNGGTVTGYGFTGREFDPETGLLYYRARYYDPKIGRFISEDPIGLAGGDANFYSYVFDNPVNLTDPFGLVTQQCRRPLKNVPGNKRLPPHVLLASTKARTGAGLGPLTGVGVLWSSPGTIEWENPYDASGKPKPEYSCQTVSTKDCVEDCVLRRLGADSNNPPRFRVGKYECDQYATDVLTACERECRGK